jgi:hypothetical protein
MLISAVSAVALAHHLAERDVAGLAYRCKQCETDHRGWVRWPPGAARQVK